MSAMIEAVYSYFQLRNRILADLPGEMDEQLAYPRFMNVTEAGVPAEVVRAILRDLRNDGLTRFMQGMDPDEFTPRGSGYVRTEAGDHLLAIHNIQPTWAAIRETLPSDARLRSH